MAQVQKRHAEGQMKIPRFKIGDKVFFIGNKDLENFVIDKIRVESTAKKTVIEYHHKGSFITEEQAFKDCYEIFDYIEKKIKSQEKKV